MKLMRKLLKKQGFAPDVLVTDKLRSYSASFRMRRTLYWSDLILTKRELALQSSRGQSWFM